MQLSSATFNTLPPSRFSPAMLAVAAHVLELAAPPSGPAAFAACFSTWGLCAYHQTPAADKVDLPLSEYNSTCEKHGTSINAMLERMRATLPAHLLQVTVDLSGWEPSQVAQLFELLANHEASFSKDKWDMGYCTTAPFRINLREDAQPTSDRPYRSATLP
jgi:hypothetical protein